MHWRGEYVTLESYCFFRDQNQFIEYTVYGSYLNFNSHYDDDSYKDCILGITPPGEDLTSVKIHWGWSHVDGWSTNTK